MMPPAIWVLDFSYDFCSYDFYRYTGLGSLYRLSRDLELFETLYSIYRVEIKFV
eukprot:SAG11_NODE_36038_length_263_cov_1.865854_1_plen_53_part_10